MDYLTFLMTVVVLQTHTDLSGALQGNCRLFGCNTVVKFDLNTQTCCGGTVYLKDLDENGNEKTKCCHGRNSMMYDVEKQECCGGQVISKDSTLMGCCGGKVFSRENNTCCNGTIQNIKRNPCCGDELVDPDAGEQCHCCGGIKFDSSSAQKCCKGRLFQRIGECCGKVLMDPSDDICCSHDGVHYIHYDVRKTQGFKTKCCGPNTYQPDDQLCCNSTVHNKTDNVTECCGNTTFNITTEVCCHGNVLPREEGKKSCCGNRLFDEDDEVCCQGKVYPGGGRAKCCNGEPFQEEKGVCFNDLVLNKTIPQIGGVVRLKKNTAYLVANQFECGNKLVTRSRRENACCNNTAYNSADQLCCEIPGSYAIVKRDPNHDRCCGLASYDTNIQGCCNTTDFHVYNLKNETCNKDGVHPRYGDIGEAKLCVRSKLDKDKVCRIGNIEIPYNSNTSVCTPKGVVALPEGIDICGNSTFNQELFICCWGKIFEGKVENETRKCCPNPVDKETFIPNSQTCFNGRVVDIPENHASFCKDKVYDNRTHECDVIGKVRSISRVEEEQHVCWFNKTHYSYFNNNTHTCCSGYVIESVWTCCAEESDCCSIGAITGYNRTKQVCCGGALRDIPVKKPSNDCRGNNCPESDDNSFLCCQGTPYENSEGNLTCDGNLVTGRLLNNKIICRGKEYNHGTDCCGDISYDNETQICCGGVLASRNFTSTCCGNHFYDPANSDDLCCESSFYENATGLSCCGGATYNSATETCCTTGSKTYVFDTKDGLCCSNGENFDNSLHTCCDGLVHKYVTNGTCCGNDVIRDPTRQGCFNDKLYQLGL